MQQEESSDGEGSSSSSDIELPSMLATSRDRRRNARAKMSQLLESEEAVDEFYSSAYGGFNEDEEEDQVYESSSGEEEGESDSTDSDFDIDEVDEPISDEDREPAEGSRKRRVVVRSHKETARSSSEPKKKKPRVHSTHRPEVDSALEKRRARRSTLLQTEKILKKQKKTAGQRTTPKSHRHQHTLTQEQMLEEARVTEQMNLKSLERYRQMEVELRSKRYKMFKRHGIKGDKISYLSITVTPQTKSEANDDPEPVLQTLAQGLQKSERGTETEVLVSESDQRGAAEPQTYSRNFLVFSDACSIEKLFPQSDSLRKAPRKEYCVVSGEPAKYRDPVTGLPYASVEAFKKLRQAYQTEIEKSADRSDPAVAQWLSWKS